MPINSYFIFIINFYSLGLTYVANRNKLKLTFLPNRHYQNN